MPSKKKKKRKKKNVLPFIFRHLQMRNWKISRQQMKHSLALQMSFFIKYLAETQALRKWACFSFLTCIQILTHCNRQREKICYKYFLIEWTKQPIQKIKYQLRMKNFHYKIFSKTLIRKLHLMPIYLSCGIQNFLVLMSKD